MKNNSPHTFHIPVMGIAFTVDSPVKIARFGISLVVSIIEDELLENLRKHYSPLADEEFIPVSLTHSDRRATRVTLYLDLLQKIIDRQMSELKKLSFLPGNELNKYFELLPCNSPLKLKYVEMQKAMDVNWKHKLQQELKEEIVPGAIDVNIMTKVDKTNYDKDGNPLPAEFSDAMAAVRGFANSKLASSVVLSAGFNPRLYNYLENFPCFLNLEKKIILKVSDFRSAQIQGKYLAKKGIWVSEFRIESGLNCGGHAFATEGHLMGPILEEFRQNRESLTRELFVLANEGRNRQGLEEFQKAPSQKLSVQGGVGNAKEHKLLIEYYKVNSVGWGSPFLLVPEATTLDYETVQELSRAKPGDFYLSDASPLGVPFNNFRRSSGNMQRIERIQKNRPGSPCIKQYLVSNTDFTEAPICTASREYQHQKLKEVRSSDLPAISIEIEENKIMAKECLCEGLGAAAYLKNDILKPKQLTAVTVCPGPNLAWFSGIFSLQEMVDHIYDRANILNKSFRPHVFLNELKLYVEYLQKQIAGLALPLQQRQLNHYISFKENLQRGIQYYKDLFNVIEGFDTHAADSFLQVLNELKGKLQEIIIPGYEQKLVTR